VELKLPHLLKYVGTLPSKMLVYTCTTSRSYLRQ